MKRTATAQERRHLATVAKMGCAVCTHCLGINDTPSVVHHVRVDHGWGRSSHTETIPLCPEHHTGMTGVHSMGRAEFAQMYGYSEIDLLELTLNQLGITA
jgi:hypothetical protein